MKSRVHPLVAVLGMGTMVFLYVPMVAMAYASINASKYKMGWQGFTWQWYQILWNDRDIFDAAVNTLLLALISTALSTVLGTLLAIGMSRFPWSRRAQALADLMVYFPVVTPDIVFAAAMVIAFGVLQVGLPRVIEFVIWCLPTATPAVIVNAFRSLASIFEPSLFTMIIAHVTFQIAFVALVVQSRLATFGHTLEEAARDLYADGWYVFRRVTLPLLMPGIIAGAMLAFTLSLDDFVISFFTKGADSTTLPIYIQASVRRGVHPKLHALCTLIFLLTVLLVLGLERLTRREKETSR